MRPVRLGEILSLVEPENHLYFIELVENGITKENYMSHAEWCSSCKHALWLAHQNQMGIARPSGLHGSQAAEKEKYDNK